MSALTLDMSPLLNAATVMAYRQEAAVWPSKGRSPGYLDVHYEVGSALTTSCQNIEIWNAAPHETLIDETWTGYQPKTALGKRLLELRRAYLASGGALMSADEMDEEIRRRRGGVTDV